jgi:hypothetical protein
MDFASVDPQKRSDQLLQRIDELRRHLREADPGLLSSYTGAHFDRNESGGEFKFKFWQDELCLEFPTLKLTKLGQNIPPNPLIQALVFYYFYTADGKPISYRWIAFSELPNGLFYNQAFQGYTGHVITRTFKNDFPRFSKRAKLIGGKIKYCRAYRCWLPVGKGMKIFQHPIKYSSIHPFHTISPPTHVPSPAVC